MTDLQKLELRASAIRGRLAQLGGMVEQTEESRSEIERLRTEYVDVEQRSTALVIAGDAPEVATKPSEDGEARELRSLRGSVDFGNYIAGAVSGSYNLRGAESEYNQHLGIQDNWFPLELLAGKESVEERAKRDGESGVSQGTWLDRVFHSTAAMNVGVSFRNVAPGVASYPITTVGGSPVQRGREEAVTESTYTQVVTEIKPSRAAVHGVYTIEDDARLPGLSESIERDMRAAMMEQIDLKVFSGDAGANETGADIVGLKTAGIGESTITQTNKVKADETLKLFLAFVDGQYAASMSDLRVVVSVGSNVLWLGSIHNSAADNQTIGQFLMASGLNWTTRGGIELNTANGNFGAYIGLSRGIDGAAIAAVWDAGQLIRDPYAGAKKGEVELTLNYLWQFALPRTANFKRLKYVT